MRVKSRYWGGAAFLLLILGPWSWVVCMQFALWQKTHFTFWKNTFFNSNQFKSHNWIRMAFLWVPGPSGGGWSSVAFGNRCKIINRRCKIIRCNMININAKKNMCKIININVKKNRCKIINRRCKIIRCNIININVKKNRCKIINRKVGLHNCANLLMPAMSN